MNKPQATIHANLGTSDLAVLIDSHGFIPLWDRSEPNDKATQESWLKRDRIILDKLCPELEVEIKRTEQIINGKEQVKRSFKFVELTEKLLYAYQQYPEKWHDRLSSGRLLGLIEKAQEKFEIYEVNVYVTKQNPIFHSDTFLLFKILQKWFKEKKRIDIKSKFIPENINPSKDIDELSDYYYNEIQNLSTDQITLIGKKGGTPQMSNTLNQQIALSSSERKIIFIDTELLVDNVLSGIPSPCKLISYWRYIRIQKYETVQQLLERWDFDGAKVILKQWHKYLKELIDLDVIDKEIQKSNSFLLKNLKVLDLACAYFNLDSSGTSNYKIKKSEDLGIFNDFEYQNSDRLLNLYAQCKIYWEIKQIANFLFRLASFGEEVLHCLITNLDGLKYFDKEYNSDDWYLIQNLRRVDETLWLKFQELEIENNPYSKIKDWNDNYQRFKLPGRYSKRNFLEALTSLRGKQKEIQTWQQISDDLKKLDYWISLRNKVTHTAEGASESGMSNLLQKDRNLKEKKALIACKRDDILPTIERMKQKTQELSKQSSQFNSDYFIYDEVKKQVIKDLMNN